MAAFRYDTSGKWFKGNVHIHSTASDGGKDFEEIAKMYAAAGYDFLCRADHWVPSDTSSDSQEYPLLWLDGVELDGKDHTGSSYHVLCIGLVEDVERGDDLVESIQSARRQGALLVLAHPHWCGNTFRDSLRWHFDGVEIYNHVCRWLNGKGDGLVYWEPMLNRNSNTLAFAVDDSHLKPEHPGWNGGWIVVNAPECSAEQILAGIRRGNFYSSCGPAFKSISLHGDVLHIMTSPVRFVRLVGPGSLGKRIGSFDGDLFTDASLQVPRDWPYVYVEIEGTGGRRAWTNTIFVDDGAQSRCRRKTSI